MPSKRTRLSRQLQSRITDEVLQAYQTRDYLRLHRALRLPPWHPSPLPLDDDPLGVDPNEPLDPNDHSVGAASWKEAVAWQTEIRAAIDEKARR